jgi:hypothetical protein
MTRSGSLRFAGGLALLALVMAAQAVMPSVADESMIAGAFFDAGHVPLFALFALIVYWLSRSTVPGGGWRHYLIAFTLVVVAGLGTEFVQKFGARDAGWMDFVRDLLGGTAALLLAFALGGGRRAPRIGALVLALALVLVGLAELGLVWRDYRGRDASFPALAGFDDPWEPRFVHGHDASLERLEADWADGRAGRVRFHTDAYPSLAIHEPFPDWTGYDALRLRVFSENPVRLTLRVHDRAHDDRYVDRFNQGLDIEAGLNEVEIPLEEIRSGPRQRELDLRAVRGVAIFADHPDEPFEVWFEDLRLVRGQERLR